jgi:hypothetical protein
LAGKGRKEVGFPDWRKGQGEATRRAGRGGSPVPGTPEESLPRRNGLWFLQRLTAGRRLCLGASVSSLVNGDDTVVTAGDGGD